MSILTLFARVHYTLKTRECVENVCIILASIQQTNYINQDSNSYLLHYSFGAPHLKVMTFSIRVSVFLMCSAVLYLIDSTYIYRHQIPYKV